MAEEKHGRVCVTGAGGFVGSWLVKLLLSKGYTVHGTLRNPEHEKKNAHLTKLENAPENLKLFKADLLDYNALSAAIMGCDGVFHVASPVPSGSVPDPEVQLIEPAVKGTVNVLKACYEAKVKRLVFVSSSAAVIMNPVWPKGKVKDESCWSDKEYCKKTNNWYSLSKTEAEGEALKFSERTGLSVVTVCPTLVLGPMLQSATNTSSLALIKLLKEGCDEEFHKWRSVVDVRDVAEALVLAYENPQAEGRYICTAHMIKLKELVVILREIYPHYKYPETCFSYEKCPAASKSLIMGKAVTTMFGPDKVHSFTEKKDEEWLSSEKLQKVGWRYRPLEETLIDSIECYEKAGILN